jgi:DNA-binding Lrp family transcriptional regulator
MYRETKRLDKTDVSILRELMEDSRISSRELSKRIKVSHQTVLSRLRRLEEAGVIKRHTLILDWSKTDKPIMAFILVESGNMSPKSLEDVRKYVRERPRFIMCGMLSGEFDMFFVCRFGGEEETARSILELRSFLSKAIDLRRFRAHTVWDMITGDIAGSSKILSA